MVIIMYDGSRLECNEIEFSNTDNCVIADGYRIVPIIEILRIITR